MLNESKGNMYGFITNTWNSIKGKCYHDCSYCHPKGTLVLMGDFSYKSIEDIKIGDSIIGIKKENSKYYKFVKSFVKNTSKRVSAIKKITTEDNFLECTEEHPLFGSIKKRIKGEFLPAEKYKIGDTLRFVSKDFNNSKNYYLGYINGFVDGDGCFFNFKNTGTNNKYIGFEAVCVNDELRLSTVSILKKHGIISKIGWKQSSLKSFNKGKKSELIYIKKQEDVHKLKKICDVDFKNQDSDFYYGYIGGMLDTDGHVEKRGNVRISQSEIANKIKCDKIKYACSKNKISYVIEKNGVRINGSFKNRMLLLSKCNPKHKEKRERLLLYKSTKGISHSKIVKIESAEEKEVYNIETECR